MAIEKNIQQKIEEALAGFDGMQRAEPRPYLQTRLMAAIANRKKVQSNWSRLAGWIGKPAVAFSLMLLFLFANLLILFKTDSSDVDSSVVNTNSNSYEYAANISSGYDLENVQP